MSGKTTIRASESVSEQAMAIVMSNGCTVVWDMDLKWKFSKHCPHEKREIRQSQVLRRKKTTLRNTLMNTLPVSRPPPQHLEQDSRADSVRCATGGHRDHQLSDSCVQVQRSAGVVRGVFEPPQFVPHCPISLVTIEGSSKRLKKF
jgi:hypothetical protein